MFKFIKVAVGIYIALLGVSANAEQLVNIGRSATPQEITAWDIDVRPDFKGLPTGSGSVDAGQKIWESRCASCHGTFGESNEVFTPIIGGVTEDDIKSGHVAALVGNKQPQKTTIMKVATISTLWDYIHRAMPWNAPKSLSNDDVFAVTAYILNLAGIVQDDFVLSDKNIADVQKLMPNRNGMTLNHGLSNEHGTPDVKSNACMANCIKDVVIRSSLPEASRNAHGNIRLQNRNFGAIRGADTTKPSLTKADLDSADIFNDEPNVPTTGNTSALEIAKKNSCLSCHGLNNKILGPGFSDVAKRYKSDASAEMLLIDKVKNGGSGNWGSMAMPAHEKMSNEDIKLLVNWILAGDK
jgi:cytochrome c